jgi:hypothetical protein
MGLKSKKGIHITYTVGIVLVIGLFAFVIFASQGPKLLELSEVLTPLKKCPDTGLNEKDYHKEIQDLLNNNKLDSALVKYEEFEVCFPEEDEATETRQEIMDIMYKVYDRNREITRSHGRGEYQKAIDDYNALMQEVKDTTYLKKYLKDKFKQVIFRSYYELFKDKYVQSSTRLDENCDWIEQSYEIIERDFWFYDEDRQIEMQLWTAGCYLKQAKSRFGVFIVPSTADVDYMINKARAAANFNIDPITQEAEVIINQMLSCEQRNGECVDTIPPGRRVMFPPTGGFEDCEKICVFKEYIS